MKNSTAKERAAGAIMGTLIGDALGVGPHWYYDLEQLKKDYGQWINNYTSPKAGRYHAGLAAGENSQTGQVVGFLLESIAALGAYDESDYCAGSSVAFGLIVAALINGETLEFASETITEQAKSHRLTLSVACPELKDGAKPDISFLDAVLQPGWSYAAAQDDAVQINPPWTACRLFGLACPLEFMLPAAYYLSSRFEDDFELPVLTAINGGGNNMARASLTGALAGAQVGLRSIPQRFIRGLADSEHLLEMAAKAAEVGETR